MVALAQHCGLGALADEHLTVPTDKGSNAGAKVSALVAGMVAGADSIDDMRLLRHGAMGTLFDRPYAPSTLGSFLRGFAFGHVRQLDAVASRLLGQLHARTPLLAAIDDTEPLDIRSGSKGNAPSVVTVDFLGTETRTIATQEVVGP
jgi:hypothetical protein